MFLQPRNAAQSRKCWPASPNRRHANSCLMPAQALVAVRLYISSLVSTTRPLAAFMCGSAILISHCSRRAPSWTWATSQKKSWVPEPQYSLSTTNIGRSHSTAACSKSSTPSALGQRPSRKWSGVTNRLPRRFSQTPSFTNSICEGLYPSGRKERKKKLILWRRGSWFSYPEFR